MIGFIIIAALIALPFAAIILKWDAWASWILAFILTAVYFVYMMTIDDDGSAGAAAGIGISAIPLFISIFALAVSGAVLLVRAMNAERQAALAQRLEDKRNANRESRERKAR